MMIARTVDLAALSHQWWFSTSSRAKYACCQKYESPDSQSGLFVKCLVLDAASQHKDKSLNGVVKQIPVSSSSRRRVRDSNPSG